MIAAHNCVLQSGNLTQTRPQLTGMVLMTPYLIEPNQTDPMRAMMDKYSQVVARLAADFDAIFVDVQAAFDRYLVLFKTHIEINKSKFAVVNLVQTS